MSARRLLVAIGLLCCPPAVPAAVLDTLGIFPADPLKTMPPVIGSGAVLPDDGAPVSCPVSKDFTLPLALNEAVDLALCSNPQIRMAWAGIKVKAGALGEARAAYFPTLSATANRLRTHNSYPDLGVPSSTTYGNTVNGTLSWRLFDFGAREANREAANRLLIAAIAHHDVALQKTLASVIQSYFDAQTAQVALQAKEQNETITRSMFDSTQRRAARGVVARSDTLQAATALAKATLEKSRAQGTYQKSLGVLIYALGISPQTRIVLADDVQDGQRENNQEPRTSRSLQDWLELAQQSHPAIVAARAEWEASQQKAKATRSEGLPTADLSVNYYQNGFPNQGVSATKSQQTTVGVSISVPFFDGFSHAYKVKGALAQAEQRQAQLQDTEQDVLMEVVKAHADATAALDNLQASENLLAAAQESVDTSQRKYEKGAADIQEILNTLTALFDAQEERIRSLADWRSTRLRLLASVGAMNRAAAGR